MFRRIVAKILGHWCESHQRGFDSDFCPECLRARLIRAERIDNSPEWTKAEGTWPLRRDTIRITTNDAPEAK